MSSPENQTGYNFTGHPEAKEFFTHISWEIPNRVEDIEKYEEELTKAAVALNWDKDTAERIGLGFREGLINAIRHGNLAITMSETEDQDYEKMALAAERTPAAEKTKVHTSIDLSPDYIQIIIQDHGGPRSQKFANEFLRHDPTSDQYILEPSGRGGLIMNEFFGKNGVRYFLNETGMQLILSRPRHLAENETPGNE